MIMHIRRRAMRYWPLVGLTAFSILIGLGGGRLRPHQDSPPARPPTPIDPLSSGAANVPRSSRASDRAAPSRGDRGGRAHRARESEFHGAGAFQYRPVTAGVGARRSWWRTD